MIYLSWTHKYFGSKLMNLDFKISSSPSAALYTRVFVLEGHACLRIKTPGGNCLSRQDSKVCRTQHGARFQASRALDNPLVFHACVWKAQDLLRPCASSKFNKGVSVNWPKQTTRVAASQRILPDSTQSSSKSHGAVLCCAVLCYAMLCYAMLCYAMLSHGTCVNKPEASKLRPFDLD